MDKEKNSRQQEYCCNCGWTLEQSSTHLYSAKVRAEESLFGFLFLTSTLELYSASVVGGRFSNSPTAAILVRWA